MRTFYEEDGFDHQEIRTAVVTGEGILFVGVKRSGQGSIIRSLRGMDPDERVKIADHVPELLYRGKSYVASSLKAHLLAQADEKRLGLPSVEATIGPSAGASRQGLSDASAGLATDA